MSWKHISLGPHANCIPPLLELEELAELDDELLLLLLLLLVEPLPELVEATEVVAAWVEPVTVTEVVDPVVDEV